MNGDSLALAPAFPINYGRLEMAHKLRLAAWVVIGASVLGTAASCNGLIPDFPGGGPSVIPNAESPGETNGTNPPPSGSDAPPIECASWNITDETKKTLKADIKDIARADIIDKQLAPGATIVVGCGTDTLASVAAGTTDGTNKPSVNNTAYDVSSVSKHLTGLGILTLVDDGKMKTSDKVGKYIPEYNKGAKKKVTIAMLMRHRSGLIDPPKYDPVLDDTVEGTWDKQIDYPLSDKYDPDTHDSYSNIGVNLAYRAGSIAAGRPLEEVVRDKIFIPIAPKHAGWKGNIKNCAPTSLDNDQTSVIRCEPQDRLARSGGGIMGHDGYIISAGAMSEILKMEAAGGVRNGKRIISESSMAELQLPFTGKHRGIGTGRNIMLYKKDSNGSYLRDENGKKIPDHRFVGDKLSPNAYTHTGWNGTEIMVDPSGVWSVIFTNGTYKRQAPGSVLYAAFRHVNDKTMTSVKP